LGFVPHDFSALARAFAAYAEIPASEFERLTSTTRVEAFEAGAVLLRQGEAADWLGFLERGLLRMVRREADREVNLGFELEGAFVGAYDAYMLRGRAQFDLEALEDGLLLRFERRVINALVAERSCWSELSRRVAEAELARKIGQEARWRTQSPGERYAELERTRSPLLGRVPQYHLASWLGVAPETLSRIRARMGTSSGS
jgi:CRP-like cAMP-binding protein